MDIETEDDMIWIEKNYLGDVARAAWEAFKDKFPGEVAKIVG